MFLEDLAQYLERAGCGVRAETIFINHIPADKPVAILLRDPPRGVTLSQETGKYRHERFPLAVRHTDIVDGAALARKVFNALQVTAPLDWTSVKVNRIYPVIEPQLYPVSSAQQSEWAVIYDASFSVKS